MILTADEVRDLRSLVNPGWHYECHYVTQVIDLPQRRIKGFVHSSRRLPDGSTAAVLIETFTVTRAKHLTSAR